MSQELQTLDLDIQKRIDEDKLGSGYVPSPNKSTDYLYSAVYEAQPLPVRYVAETTPLLDQGDKGYCWSFATTNTRNCQEQVDGRERYSPEYCIRKTKHTHGNLNIQGETADNSAKTWTEYGALLEGDLPYAMKYPPDKTTPEMDVKASKRKALSYAKVTTLQEVKQAIFTHQAVALGVLVLDSWYKCDKKDKNGHYVVEMPWGSFLGGHLMCADGFDDSIKLYDSDGVEYIGGIRIKNSWKNWGTPDGGYAWMPYQWLLTKTDVGMTFWDLGIVFVDKIENPTGATRRKIQFKVGSVDYTINGYQNKMDTAPIIKDSRTLIPVRFLVEALGLNVYWDEPKQEVSIYNEKMTVKMVIGKRDVLVNGKKVTLDVPPQIINSRTHIPLRFVSEIFECTVNWDNADQFITIVK